MFIMSPEVGFLIAIVIILWLIGAGVKSIGRNISSVDSDSNSKYEVIMQNMGPMTWKERFVSLILITIFFAFVVWLAW